MIMVNTLSKQPHISREAYTTLIQLLNPFAPHLTEEIWEQLGNTESLVNHPWPSYDQELVREEHIELVIQINGKVRDKIMVAADILEADVRSQALASEKIKPYLTTEPKKIIYIAGRLVNIVV